RVVPTQQEFIYGRRYNLLSKTICALKTTSSKKIHENGQDIFKWQRSFHDRIIRNHVELERIRKYIIANPANWKSDKNNKLFKN
ncbi:transposase, partial [Patescibacteria group bacterium]|nr:transposase [Patescibacteria group bacterium]MBU1673374.1 transposase [Patescibacteria group bacterium]MBU1963458.1 transposase [Patescibacteria group bacterium]